MAFEDRPEWRLLVALGVGLVLGLERERARGAERPRRWAGLRTFALTSLLGGVALQTGSAVVVGVSGAAVALLALLVAWRATEPDPGLTTEVALVLASPRRPGAACPGAGLRRGARRPRCSPSAPACTGWPEALHRPRAAERAGAGVAALLVSRPPGQARGSIGAISPFDVWKLVVVVMAVGAAGALAQRLVRPRVGLTVAGLASGFVSSAATVAGMGRLASSEPRLLAAAVSGATASSVATFVQLALLIAASGTVLLRSLAFALGAGGLTALAVAAAPRGGRRRPRRRRFVRGRLRLVDAVVFAGLVTLISFLAAVVQRRSGTPASSPPRCSAASPTRTPSPGPPVPSSLARLSGWRPRGSPCPRHLNHAVTKGARRHLRAAGLSGPGPRRTGRGDGRHLGWLAPRPGLRPGPCIFKIWRYIFT
jgi:hypothetical protein